MRKVPLCCSYDPYVICDYLDTSGMDRTIECKVCHRYKQPDEKGVFATGALPSLRELHLLLQLYWIKFIFFLEMTFLPIKYHGWYILVNRDKKIKHNEFRFYSGIITNKNEHGKLSASYVFSYYLFTSRRAAIKECKRYIDKWLVNKPDNDKNTDPNTGK